MDSLERKAMLDSISKTFGGLGAERVEWRSEDGTLDHAIEINPKDIAKTEIDDAGKLGYADELKAPRPKVVEGAPAPTASPEDVEVMEAKKIATKEKPARKMTKAERRKARKAALDALSSLDADEISKIDPHKFTDMAEVIKEVGRPDRVQVSDTALVHDAWSMRRGSELAEDWNKSRSVKEPAADGGAGKTIKKEETPEDAKLTPAEIAKRKPMTDEEAADFHGQFFLPEAEYERHVTEDAKARAIFLDRLKNSEEYKLMHHRTCRDDIASELAAITYRTKFVEYMETEKKAGRDGCGKDGMGGGGMGKALGDAARECHKDIDELEETMGAFGMSMGGDGPNPGSSDARAIAKLHQKVRKSKKLKDIMTWAGKFRRLAASRQKIKAKHGMDEVVGIEQGNTIEKLIPQELMHLADDCEFVSDDAMRRLIESQTLIRDTASLDSVGKGPIIVCIDESGSMGGEKNITAKALGLAMAWIAKRQKRYCALVSYTGAGSEHNMGHYNYIVNRCGEWDADALAKWLEQFLGGGGNRDLPVLEIPEIYKKVGAPAGKTDVVMIGDCQIPNMDTKKYIDPILKFKKDNKVTIQTIVIQSEAGKTMEAISDSVFIVPALSVDSEAVEAAVSI